MCNPRLLSLYLRAISESICAQFLLSYRMAVERAMLIHVAGDRAWLISILSQRGFITVLLDLFSDLRNSRFHQVSILLDIMTDIFSHKIT